MRIRMEFFIFYLYPMDTYVFSPTGSLPLLDPDLNPGGPKTCVFNGYGHRLKSPIMVFPSRIPDPNCLHSGSRFLIKELKYFNTKKPKKMVSQLLKIWSGLFIPDPGSGY